MAFFASATITIVDINGAGQFTSIQQAINNASTADTIQVWPGTYNEAININKNIVLQGSGYENTIITGSFNPTVTISVGEIKWFMISSLAGNGIKISAGKVNSCVIKGCSAAGILSNQGTSSVINCTIVNNNGDGIVTDCGSTAWINVVNCISYGNTGTGFKNNNGQYCGGPTIALSYSNGSTSGTTGNQGCISSDPIFISSTNYHLSSGSPCLNSGQPSLSDPDGSISDMGYFGGPTCPIFPVVYEMTITPNGNNINVQAKARANY